MKNIIFYSILSGRSKRRLLREGRAVTQYCTNTKDRTYSEKSMIYLTRGKDKREKLTIQRAEFINELVSHVFTRNY